MGYMIPMHNEAQYIGKCLRAAQAAAAAVLPLKTEIIVAANRCTDRTAEIAERMGAKVVHNDDKCIAAIRNTGIRAARGKIIVTCDADSRMTADTLKEVRLKALGDKRGQKYGVLRKAYAVTSARKFDRFGYWYPIRDRKLTKQIFTGKNREAADKFYYDVR